MISIIIPVYNITPDLTDMTDKCMASLFATTPEDTDIILVDDGSPIPYRLESGTTVRHMSNLGYSQAVNSGLSVALGDIIVVGNNDLTFPEDWLKGLLLPLKKGFDVATVWTTDQKYKLSEEIEDNAAFGSIFAMDRQVYDQIGGMDTQFRGYFADTDYRHRILEAGFLIGKNHACLVHHASKSTYKQTDPHNEEFTRAMRLYEIKYGVVE